MMYKWHPDATPQIFPAKGKPWVGGSGRRKLVLHTIESNGWPNYTAPPHLTLNPNTGELRQHVPFDLAAYALRHNESEEQRYAYQIELWGRAANTPDYDDNWYRGVAKQVAWFINNMGVKHIYADFTEMTYGTEAPQRMTPAETDAFEGILGHAHWGRGTDTHWDPGRLDVERLDRFVEEELMPDLGDKETSNPDFQPAWDKARASGMYSAYTEPSDIVNAETHAVFHDRVGYFEYDARISALEQRIAELELGVLPDHTHTQSPNTGGVA